MERKEVLEILKRRYIIYKKYSYINFGTKYLTVIIQKKDEAIFLSVFRLKKLMDIGLTSLFSFDKDKLRLHFEIK